MATATLFRIGRSQVVRLPKEFRFGGTEVVVKHFGDGVLLLPRTATWREWVVGLAGFPEDFMETREQPAAYDRRAEQGP